MLNTLLNSAMSLNQQGKNNVALSCVLNPPIDDKDTDKMVPMLIRVKNKKETILNEKKNVEQSEMTSLSKQCSAIFLEHVSDFLFLHCYNFSAFLEFLVSRLISCHTIKLLFDSYISVALSNASHQ